MQLNLMEHPRVSVWCGHVSWSIYVMYRGLSKSPTKGKCQIWSHLALLIGLAYSFPENEGPLELSGGCLLTCFFIVCIEPCGCSGGMGPSIPAQMDSLDVAHLNWQMPVCHARLFQYPYRCVGRDKRVFSGSSSSPLPFVMWLKWLSSRKGGGFGFARFCPTVNHCVSVAETAELAVSSEQQGWEQGAGLFSSKLAGMQAAGVLWGHGWSLCAAAASPSLSSSPLGSHKRCWG